MTALTPLPNWRVYFDALLCERLNTPFRWGVHDCVLFAADSVLAITGVDLASDVRNYRNARQALRMIRQRGGLRAIVQARLGWPLPATYACVGDVVLMPMCGREALGVCINSHQVAGPGEYGLHVAPLADALCSWRVR